MVDMHLVFLGISWSISLVVMVVAVRRAMAVMEELGRIHISLIAELHEASFFIRREPLFGRATVEESKLSPGTVFVPDNKSDRV